MPLTLASRVQAFFQLEACVICATVREANRGACRQLCFTVILRFI